MDAMLTAIIVLDDRLSVVYLNSSAQDVLQTSFSQAINTPLTEYVIGAEKLVDQLENALETLQPFTEREASLRLPDNQSVAADLSASIVDLAASRPEILIELQPLNRLKRINKDEESLVRQETTRHLIRGLAHEIKNPLGGIRGAAQLLERLLDSEEDREYTAVIISEADRLKNLVDRMLGPQRQLDLAPVNILKVCEHIIALINAESPDRIKWRRDYDPSLPDVLADEAQMIQAVLNIVRNACEALRDTPDARVQIKSRGVRQFTIGQIRHRLVLQLDIIDNGPGVPEELEDRIFFPMISGRPDGTGLGLVLTQNIIAQHGGSIQLQTRPGYTCFSVYLPFE
ncbi:MAG: nitrogen regulation protein NR(II) [Pseudomonadota bacterium]